MLEDSSTLSKLCRKTDSSPHAYYQPTLTNIMSNQARAEVLLIENKTWDPPPKGLGPTYKSLRHSLRLISH